MDDTLKQQVVLAAAHLAGPGATAAAITAEAKRLAGYVTPGSAVMNAIDYASEQAAAAPAGKPFIATLLHVDVELSSNRGVLFLQNGKGEVEVIRTEITKGNPEAQAVVSELTGLIGHSLAVTKRIETSRANPNVKVRILVAYEDRGLDAVAAAEDFGVDWDAWDADSSRKPLRSNLKLAAEGVVLSVGQDA